MKEVKKNGGNTQKKGGNIVDKELFDILVVRRGGKTTFKILDALLKRPYNANQISDLLNISYNTVRYHLKILVEHGYVETIKLSKTIVIHPSEKLLKSYDEYLFIKSNYHK